ncbi:hypothetical protein CFC21_051274 [Triticum aestivum]|uniref:Uncharacterized protein n=3 Tax=Triticum TaxID=4564 RepID=A0A3B6HRK7_WHEAT|nr:transcription factor MYB77-like [Triticum aestivum]KAF7041483.1 hypothetical protein CFC21_051274 [Triticum aestivum]
MAAEGGGGGDVGRADGCKKTPWTPEEDEALRRGVREHGAKSWDAIALALPGRASKSCRLRWCQHLSPELDSRPFTPEEDEEIIRRQREFGNKWATIARYLTGRSDNSVKNRWNSTLRKQLLGAHATEDDAAAAEDDQAVRVCLQLFPMTAGVLEEEAEAAAAAEGDVTTDLTLGLPGLGEASAVDLSLSL